VIEESLLWRAPHGRGGTPRAFTEFLDPTAFEDRLREARARRAQALAGRAASAVPAPPPDPRIAWAREAPIPPRPGFSWPEKPKSAFVPPFAIRDSERECSNPGPDPVAGTPDASQGDALPRMGAAGREAAAEPRPRARGTPRIATLTSLGALAARVPAGKLALLTAAGFARAHAVPIVASFLVAGAALGTAMVLLAPDAPAPAAPAPVVEVAAAPPAATPAPEPAAPAVSPLTAPSVEVAPAPTKAEAPAAIVAPAETETGPEVDLTAAAVAEVAPDQIAALEPRTSAPTTLATEYFAARPRPRPALVASASPGLAATGDAVSMAAPRFAETRVVVNYSGGTSGAEVAKVSDTITDAGFPAVQSARVNVDMSAANVRYFHAADAEAARALGAATGATVRDFTSFTPSPRAGHLELWLPGTATRTAAAPEDRILGILRDRATRN
jgi:hypothetical protein